MDKKLLERLSNAFGPPGEETEPAKILIEELEDYADEVRTDKMGNVFFTHKGDRLSGNVWVRQPRRPLLRRLHEVASKGPGPPKRTHR